MSDILIVGRGPSIYEFDWDRAGKMPVMAVSSGAFAIPDTIQVSHFVTMDPLKFFMAALMDSTISWSQDKNAKHRAFWRDDGIVKHVLRSRLRPATYRKLPEQIWDVVPDRHIAKFQKALSGSMHAFGFQPSWGDCPNVRGWDVEIEGGPNLGGDGERLGIEGVRNSWLMAVQVAVQLGYTRLHFAGCDFRHECYSSLLLTVKRWHDLFSEHGIEWVSLTDSALCEFMSSRFAA